MTQWRNRPPNCRGADVRQHVGVGACDDLTLPEAGVRHSRQRTDLPKRVVVTVGGTQRDRKPIAVVDIAGVPHVDLARTGVPRGHHRMVRRHHDAAAHLRDDLDEVTWVLATREGAHREELGRLAARPPRGHLDPDRLRHRAIVVPVLSPECFQRTQADGAAGPDEHRLPAIEAAPPKSHSRRQELGADTGVESHSLGHLGDVGAHLLAHVGDLVDE